MARVPNRGESSANEEIDLGFLDGVQASHESYREDLRAYLTENPDAAAALRWIVEQWGAENTKVEWGGDTKRGLPDYEYTAPCFVFRLPLNSDFSVASNAERYRFHQALVRHFPSVERHFLVLP